MVEELNYKYICSYLYTKTKNKQKNNAICNIMIRNERYITEDIK